MTSEKVADAIERAAAILGPRAARDVPLGPRTTYREGGAAALFVELERDEDLDVLAESVRESGVEVLIVGNGSNLLVSESGFLGLAVVLGEHFSSVRCEATSVVAGGGASLPVVARKSAAAGLRGFEWAVGVPGSVGGAVAMNAGGHGSDVASCLQSTEVFALTESRRLTLVRDELSFSYRSSSIGESDVVLQATFRVQAGEVEEAQGEIDEIVRWRREHQPGGRNAGSVFTNPPGTSAGALIDAAGLKGARIGSASVSDKHANFIQLDQGGRADDVVALISHVRRVVEEREGVELVPEVRLVGFSNLGFAHRGVDRR